jgi:threonine/homoserine/homoserine lactone efflux protein
MTSQLAIVTLFVVAAITPGPNNLMVMRSAARTGLAGAVAPVAGIVAGSLALLAAVVAGIGALVQQWPPLRALIGAGAALYMLWFGLSLILPRRAAAGERELPGGALGAFVFQFLNPKGWLMMLTAVGASSARGTLATFVFLAPLATFIPLVCLLLWAAVGRALSVYLKRTTLAVWIDRVFGALLIAGVLPFLA